MVRTSRRTTARSRNLPDREVVDGAKGSFKCAVEGMKLQQHNYRVTSVEPNLASRLRHNNKMQPSCRRAAHTLEHQSRQPADLCRSHSTLLGTRLTDKSHSWLCVGLLDAQSGVIAENFARRFNRNSHAARRLGLLTQRASRMIAINDSASNVKQLDTMMIHKISAAPARSTCHVARTVVT